MLTKKVWIILFTAVMMIGAYTATGYSFLSMLITSVGFSTKNAAEITMVSGILVLLSKNIYGFLTDRFDTRKCNYFFGFITFAAFVLVVLCIVQILYRKAVK